MIGRTLSLRAKLILSAVLGATVPLAITGVWLAYATQSGAAELLRSELEHELDGIAAEIGERWVHRRSDLLLLVDNETVRAALDRDDASGDDAALRFLRSAIAGMQPAIDRAIIHDDGGTPRWVLSWSPLDEPVVEPAATSAALDIEPAGPVLEFSLPIRDATDGREVGSLQASIRLTYVLPNGRSPGGTRDPVLGVVDRATGRPIVMARPLDERMLLGRVLRFEQGDTTWLVGRRSLAEPALDLAMASPLEPYVGPFRRSTRIGLLILLLVGVGGIAVAVFLGRHLSRSLHRLVTAAEAVSEGDLEWTVEESASRDEVGRLARAFNRMTASLRDTLAEQARRESVSAVGDFAYGVAHEVRNPLTSLRLDLEIADEKLPAQARARAPLRRALDTLERLDTTVTGVLGIARSGRVEMRPIDLGAVLRSAVQRTEPEFSTRRAGIDLRLPDESLVIAGDADALERLFVNLLINSARALDEGGRTTIDVAREGGRIAVTVRDDGCGIQPDHLPRVFDPFYSAAQGGTGLGLPISMQIARAHGGSIEIQSAPGEGTVVHVTLTAG